MITMLGRRKFCLVSAEVDERLIKSKIWSQEEEKDERDVDK